MATAPFRTLTQGKITRKKKRLANSQRVKCHLSSPRLPVTTTKKRDKAREKSNTHFRFVKFLFVLVSFKLFVVSRHILDHIYRETAMLIAKNKVFLGGKLINLPCFSTFESAYTFSSLLSCLRLSRTTNAFHMVKVSL